MGSVNADGMPPTRAIKSDEQSMLLAADALVMHFKQIVQSSDDAIVSKNLDGIITSWNPGAEAIFGFTAEEMVGNSMFALLPPDLYNEENEILEKLRKGEKVDHLETVRLRKDGSLIDVSVTSSPIRDATGKIVGASKIARDISQKKHNESRLKLISSVFINTNEGIVITGPDGVIIESNESFSRISGYCREEVLGKTSRLFRSSRQGPEFVREVCDSLLATDHYQGEAWSRRKDGEAYAGILTINAVRDENGRISNYVALFADITPLRLKQEQLEHLAHFDALTDLPNRILLEDRLHQAMAMARRHAQSVAVLYLDIDYFKEINDRHGHDVGDKLLIAVSRRMKQAIRDIDTLARIGGDEFVAVLCDIGPPQEYGHFIGRILRACSDPIIIGDVVLQVSASIGVTIFPNDDADADQLMRHADRAMYEAKQAGKNRFHLFDSAGEAEVKHRSVQLERIEEAIRAQEFILYYQPKVNMRTGAVFGMEALIRWRHPERGLLYPAEFLAVIENHPSEDLIGYWVIDSALRQMDAWLRMGLHMSVSVNLGAGQLQKPGFASALQRLLAKYANVAPRDLELEILETSALRDIDAFLVVMQDCHALGVCFAVDDFGTGYSSLTYLRRLPAETLKIDQSFVRGMLVDDDDLAIVQGVIALAAAFRRKVIAEGVETVEIGERLLDMGCELAQGYGIARPMPCSEIPAWIAKWRPSALWMNRTVGL